MSAKVQKAFDQKAFERNRQMILAGTIRCDRDALQKLLNGQLSEPSEASITSHLDSCEACRAELESLAASEDWWQETHELLTGCAETTLRVVNRSDFDRSFHFESADVPSLSFLSPSDNSAILGRLGEFDVLEFIGRGGMGIVLKGYDHELNRFVAIKVLGAHYAENSAARQRFAREAQAAAAIVHPHVVAIHTVSAMHRPPYFVMPFVPGETLQQRLDRTGPLPVTDVLQFGHQIADGLAAAHARGLIHRDIKPANILLERNTDRILLTDFGLARAIDDASLTQSGVIAGTPDYMSPEQARGESIDTRTDLFSFGSVLYALLAGHPPFQAASPYGVLRRVNEAVPLSLRTINPQVPDWLDALIGRLLEKQPAARWQSAQEVADLLSQCLAHCLQPAVNRLPPPVASLLRQRWSRFIPRILAGIITFFGGLSLMLILNGWMFTSHSKVTKPGVPEAEEPAALYSTSVRPTSADFQAPIPIDHWDDQLGDDVGQVDERLEVLESEAEF